MDSSHTKQPQKRWLERFQSRCPGPLRSKSPPPLHCSSPPAWGARFLLRSDPHILYLSSWPFLERGSIQIRPCRESASKPRDWQRPCALTRREDDNGSALPHPIKKIDDILVGHTDATGLYGLADIFRLVGAVDAVQGVLVALVKIERPGPQRISRTSVNTCGVRAEPRLNFRRRDPIRPLSHLADCSDAGEGQRFLPDRHAVPERLSFRQDEIKIARIGIHQDRARSLPAWIVDDVPAEALGDVCLGIRRMGQQLPISGRQTCIRRRRERSLHASTEHQREKPYKQQRWPRPWHCLYSKRLDSQLLLLEYCTNQGVITADQY